MTILDCMPQLFFKAQYVWFPSHLYVSLIPNSSGQLAESIVCIIPRADLYSHQIPLVACEWQSNTALFSLVTAQLGQRIGIRLWSKKIPYTSLLTHWGVDKMAGISQTIFLKRIFWNEKVKIFIPISLKLVSKGPFNNKSALVQIMAWRRSGHYVNQWWLVYWYICFTQPQWVNSMTPRRYDWNFR